METLSALKTHLIVADGEHLVHGYDSPQGFVVTKDSQAMAVSAPSARPGLAKLRDDLLRQGVLANRGEVLCFTQDYVFSSPSAAAGLVLGREANGRTEWKDEAGRTLQQIQQPEEGA